MFFFFFQRIVHTYKGEPVQHGVYNSVLDGVRKKARKFLSERGFKNLDPF